MMFLNFDCDDLCVMTKENHALYICGRTMP